MTARHTLELLQKLGPAWALYRAGYALRGKTGLLKRRFPASQWDRTTLADLLPRSEALDVADIKQFHLKHGGRFFFDAGTLPDRALLNDILTPEGRQRTIDVADDYCRGRFLYFSDQSYDLGSPPNWLLNPINGAEHNANLHWCDYPTFSPALGDIKEVWEPSRFACAYWLVRAYVLTGDEKYPSAFWNLFETWATQNPPNMGPNWKCGQETSVRIFAWCFALHGFWNSSATTNERVAAMIRLLAIQAERIYHNIDFAISQKNNHSMSEAAGLVTVGLLFPYLTDASIWLARGRSVLENDIRRQIYDDGSFVQHSMNYHRVMLHVCLWVMCLSECNNQPLTDEARNRLSRAAEFISSMLDPKSGGTPNYGANDGALVLPLSACPYEDFRPTVQAARYWASGQRAIERGPWDEMLAWLFGTKSIKGTVDRQAPKSKRLDAGGYYTIRGEHSWAMIRCHAYRDRPVHVDMLHLDLWYKGVNVLSDSGSYKYYTPESRGLDKYFKDIAAHNTVEVDGRGPLDLASRFLWLPWPGARCIDHQNDRFQGEHDAYNRPPWNVTHRRTVELESGDVWVVTDDLTGEGEHQLTLRWHLADGDFQLAAAQHRATLGLPDLQMALEINGPEGMSITAARGLDAPPEYAGWMSTHYGRRLSRPTVKAHGRFALPARFVSRISVVAKPQTHSANKHSAIRIPNSAFG